MLSHPQRSLLLGGLMPQRHQLGAKDETQRSPLAGETQRSPLLGATRAGISQSERQLISAREDLVPIRATNTQDASSFSKREVRHGAPIMEYLTKEMRAQLSPIARLGREAHPPSSRLRRLSLGPRQDETESASSPLAFVNPLRTSFQQPPSLHMILVPREIAEKADEIIQGPSAQTRTSFTRRKSIETDANAGSHPRAVSAQRNSSPSRPPSHSPTRPRSPARHKKDPAATALVFFDAKTSRSKNSTSLPNKKSQLDAPTSHFNADRPPSPKTFSLIRQISELRILPPRPDASSPPDEREDAHFPRAGGAVDGLREQVYL